MKVGKRAHELAPCIAIAFIVFLNAGCVPDNMVLVSNEEELRRAKGMETPARDNTSDRIWLPRYRVIPAMHPTYRVLTAIQPPEVPEELKCGAVLDRCMVAIEPEDEWRVTHKIGTEYLIQSKSFTERLCRHISGSSYLALERLGICSIWRDFAIAISSDGAITRGWELLQNRSQTGNRLFYHSLGRVDASGWPTGVVFVPSAK